MVILLYFYYGLMVNKTYDILLSDKKRREYL
jgi:hypothetical protein